jgi:hypothetical protein
MARADPPEEEFAYKTRSEQRLEWLKTRERPLTDEEGDELYRCLHAIYERDRRRYCAERELNRPTAKEDKRENTRLLDKVLREATREVVS